MTTIFSYEFAQSYAITFVSAYGIIHAKIIIITIQFYKTTTWTKTHTPYHIEILRHILNDESVILLFLVTVTRLKYIKHAIYM